MQYIGIQFNDRNIEVSEVNLKALTDSFQGRSLPTAERFFFENWLPAQLYNVDR